VVAHPVRYSQISKRAQDDLGRTLLALVELNVETMKLRAAIRADSLMLPKHLEIASKDAADLGGLRGQQARILSQLRTHLDARARGEAHVYAEDKRREAQRDAASKPGRVSMTLRLSIPEAVADAVRAMNAEERGEILAEAVSKAAL